MSTDEIRIQFVVDGELRKAEDIAEEMLSIFYLTVHDENEPINLEEYNENKKEMLVFAKELLQQFEDARDGKPRVLQ